MIGRGWFAHPWRIRSAKRNWPIVVNSFSPGVYSYIFQVGRYAGVSFTPHAPYRYCSGWDGPAGNKWETAPAVISITAWRPKRRKTKGWHYRYYYGYVYPWMLKLWACAAVFAVLCAVL